MANPITGTPAAVESPAAAAGFLSAHSAQFSAGVTTLNEKYAAALETLKSNPSDPGALANYQSMLGEYTLYRNLQSNSTKALKDVDMAIVGNLR